MRLRKKEKREGKERTREREKTYFLKKWNLRKFVSILELNLFPNDQLIFEFFGLNLKKSTK